MVTGNKNKLREVRGILGNDLPFELDMASYDEPEIQGTPEEIVRYKCLAASEAIGGPVIVEDNALQFEALGGMPGPYVKDFLAAVGPEGLHRMLLGWKNKAALACSYVAFYNSDTESVELFYGNVSGSIVAPRGDDGFGWDCIFQPDACRQTFAEMTAQQKNGMSHRRLAFEGLRDHLQALPASPEPHVAQHAAHEPAEKLAVSR